MRQLLPADPLRGDHGPPEQFDLSVLLGREDRVAPQGRPWVMANMVASVDGAFSVQGRSGGLSGDADRAVFHALRAAADVVLVAAGTARQEQYRRPRTTDERWLEQRRSAGLSDDPRLVLVSRTLELPGDLPLLSGPGQVPLVLHPSSADPAQLPAGIEACASDAAHDVDLLEALRTLRTEGVEVVLCEGGPSLLGQLHAADLLDELFLTTSPVLVGGDRLGLLGSTPEHPRHQRLHRLLEADGALLHTYRAQRG